MGNTEEIKIEGTIVESAPEVVVEETTVEEVAEESASDAGVCVSCEA